MPGLHCIFQAFVQNGMQTVENPVTVPGPEGRAHDFCLGIVGGLQ